MHDYSFNILCFGFYIQIIEVYVSIIFILLFQYFLTGILCSGSACGGGCCCGACCHWGGWGHPALTPVVRLGLATKGFP